MVAAALGGVGVGVAAAAAHVAIDLPLALVVGLAAPVVAGGLAVAWWWPGVRYRHWRYRLGPDALELSSGPVVRTESVIPYFRVQHVDTAQGPIERRLRLTNLRIHTASAATDGTLPGLGVDEADEVRRRMLGRAGFGDAV